MLRSTDFEASSASFISTSCGSSLELSALAAEACRSAVRDAPFHPKFSYFSRRFDMFSSSASVYVKTGTGNPG